MCCTSATHDVNYVMCRSKHEGLSFLTITLPGFGKDFEKSLDQGRVDHELFQGFTWRAGLPRFLGGFLDRVFDRSSGLLLDVPCVDAIRAIRLLTRSFGKIDLPCSQEREQAAIQKYVMCEQEVREHDLSMSASDIADFRRIFSQLFAGLMSRVDYDVYYGHLIPKHGPGATADKLRGNSKFRNTTWTTRLEEILPSGENLIPSPSYMEEQDAVNFLEPGSEIPVKVITVPKTQKGPRIIAIEPTAMQYAQQAILGSIVTNLDRFSHLSRMIGFEDQTPNQRLARKGSLDGSLATLDLSDASDRVSNQLVRTMLEPWPHLHKAVDASRSRSADVPGHGVIRLAKFASMGSALTFPMEAMVFTTCIFLGIERALNRPLDQRDVVSLSDKVRVYGDDIIVPVEFVQSVVAVLEAFGAVVNSDKSFWTGSFRESCGREYYAGVDVSIVHVRQMFPTHRKHATRVISTVSLRNQLYYAGYWDTCSWLDGEIAQVLRYFPVVLPTSRVLGRHSFLGFETQKIGMHHHNPMVKGYVVSAVLPSDPLDGPAALLKFHLSRARRSEHRSDDDYVADPTVHLAGPLSEAGHLERAGRPHAVNIKLRWASAV